MTGRHLMHAIDVALKAVDSHNHSDDAAERAWAFVAFLSGAVEVNDKELSERISKVLRPCTPGAKP